MGMKTFAQATQARQYLEKLSTARDDNKKLTTVNVQVHCVSIQGPHLPGLQHVAMENYPHWKEGLLMMMRETVAARIKKIEEEITKLGFEVPQ